MATFSEYKRQRIVSLWHDGRKAPTIATIDRSSSEVGPKFERSWTEVRAKFFLRSSLRSGNIFSVPTVFHIYISIYILYVCLHRVPTLEDLDEDKVAWIPSKILHGYFRDSMEDKLV